MTWTIEWDEDARKDLLQLDRPVQRRIVRYLLDRVARAPEGYGKPLRAKLSGLRRYRTGDFRIVCQIENHKLVVLVVAVGHRRDIYSRL